MALPPENQNNKPDPDKKSHWSQRVKQGVAKTLDFVKTYTPAVFSTTVRVAAMTTIVASVAAGTGSSFVSPEVAGVLGALASQSKRIWELVKDMKDYLDATKDTLGEDAGLDEKDQMIQELRERLDGLQSNQDTLMDAIEQLSGANEHLMKGNDQLKDALRKYYHQEINDVEVAGLLERYPFDFEKEGTMFGEVQDGVKTPLNQKSSANGQPSNEMAEELALTDESDDSDNHYLR